MVNTGKPSGACGVCRERRIKCDETKPTCLKCLRSGRICSGYLHGLKLRDQTQKTILKAQFGKPTRAIKHKGKPRQSQEDEYKAQASRRAPTLLVGGGPRKHHATKPRSASLPGRGVMMADDAVAAKKRHKRSSSGSAVAEQQHRWSASQWQMAENETLDPQLWRTIHTPLVEQARCYFLSSYVVYNPSSAAEGMFTFIPSLLAAEQPGKEHFEDLFSAVAIAAFATRPNAGQAAMAATTYYARGIARLRNDLGDKTHAKSDTALASTILLGFYEGIVDEGVGLVSYNPHFEGAITLLRMRGQEQFATSHGIEMFDFVMQILMRQYAHSLTCTEEDILRWTMHASMRPKEGRPHLFAMYVGSLRLRAARLCDKVVRDEATMREAIEILQTAQKFEKLVTQRVKPSPGAVGHFSSESPASPNNDPIPGHPDWWTATKTLNKHAFRLLVCHIIADVCAWLDWPTAGLDENSLFREPCAQAAAVARRDITSIIVAIPYLCEWTDGKMRGASSPCGQDDAESTRGITHFLVIWPLYLAGDSRFASAEQKEYIHYKLELMAENLGVRHASAVSQYLKDQAAAVGSPCSEP